ncbi:hypothetical protein AMTRI_Chr12g235710 [Amborella trichopoda]
MSHQRKEITRIFDKNKRHVSFSKRKGGRLFIYGNPSIDDIITKYLQGPQLLHESHWKHLQYLRTLHSKIQSQFEDATKLFKLDVHSMDIFEMEIQELEEYASMLPENGDNNVNLDSVESSYQTLYQENSHEDLTSTSRLPYSMDLIHQQKYGPKYSYLEEENVKMGCSFGLSEINDVNHRGSINAMNLCFSNGECKALYLCPQDEGIEMSNSLYLFETSDWNHLGSINYMNSYLCNGESRPKSLYPQDENIEMGCSFGLSEISDVNHHRSINDMNVYHCNGECVPLFMCSEDEGIGMSNSLGLTEIVVGIILEHQGYKFLFL